MRQRVLGKTPDNVMQLNLRIKRRCSDCAISLVCWAIRHLTDSTCGTLLRMEILMREITHATCGAQARTRCVLLSCAKSHRMDVPCHAFAEDDWASKKTACKSSFGAPSTLGNSVFETSSTTQGVISHSSDEAEVLSCKLEQKAFGIVTRRGYGRGKHLGVKVLCCQEAIQQGRSDDPADSDTKTMSADYVDHLP